MPGPILHMGAAVLCAHGGQAQPTVPNPRVLELCMIQGPLQWEICAEKPPIVDGWLEFPQRPGLGVQLAEGLTERFPYIEGDYMIQVTR